VKEKVDSLLRSMDVDPSEFEGNRVIYTPINGSEIGSICDVGFSTEEVSLAINQSVEAFDKWKHVPAPRRGELIRLFAEELRLHKQELGELVTIENGKILQEGLGEVQEMIDICDFAVGLSRQLYGLTIASERPGHKLLETWHPLGPIAVITAFNFPVAVWSWNFATPIVCGNSVIWKPSEKTPFTALACHQLFLNAVEKFGEDAPKNLSQVIFGGAIVGADLAESDNIKLVSATGSTNMGKTVAPIVAARLGRCLLELGGNNAMIVAPSADLDMALKAIVFSAVGTAGQRCTTLRRVIVHTDIYYQLVPRLKKIYKTISIGNPLDEKNLVGPLIDGSAYDNMERALTQATNENGIVFGGARVLEDKFSAHSFYVKPAIVEMPEQSAIVKTETFAPILYIMRYSEFDDALEMHNDVPQGLSSCIFSTDIRETERFLSTSDCGLANVNIGTNGAEIGGAFGGEKETGGGRESGSDTWKNYMRRATNTINYSTELPLAQGIKFDIGEDDD